MGPRKLAATVRRLAELDAEVTLHEELARQAREAREQLRAELRPVLEPETKLRAGGYLIWRTETSPVERFSLRAMREAGAELPKSLERFVTRSASERWYLREARKAAKVA